MLDLFDLAPLVASKFQIGQYLTQLPELLSELFARFLDDPETGTLHWSWSGSDLSITVTVTPWIRSPSSGGSTIRPAEEKQADPAATPMVTPIARSFARLKDELRSEPANKSR